MREHLYYTVAEGTGKTARPAGYAIGGKTGTAEMVPRDKTNYVVSFIGFAPADDPQIVIYCVIDRPNVAKQASASYATGVVKNILTEVLPYLHIARTEEMTIAEQAEVDSILGSIVQADTPEGDGGDASEDGQEGDNGEAVNGDTSKKPFYIVDPDTGELMDPTTGEKAQMDYSMEDGDGSPVAGADGNGGTAAPN